MSIASSGENKIITFLLAKQTFGIDMKSLIEIREWEAPTPLPRVPAYLKGVTNLRGTVVPVVGLAERLGWTASVIHSRSCILVVDIGGKQVGLLVDEIADIVPVKTEDVQPAPESELGDPSAISGLIQITTRAADEKAALKSGTMVLLLDLDVLSLSTTMSLAA
jgi:purine-binding chemotaxis protein CheW